MRAVYLYDNITHSISSNRCMPHLPFFIVLFHSDLEMLAHIHMVEMKWKKGWTEQDCHLFVDKARWQIKYLAQQAQKDVALGSLSAFFCSPVNCNSGYHNRGLRHHYHWAASMNRHMLSAEMLMGDCQWFAIISEPYGTIGVTFRTRHPFLFYFFIRQASIRTYTLLTLTTLNLEFPIGLMCMFLDCVRKANN